MNPWLWNPILWNSEYIKTNFIMNPTPPTLYAIMDAMANFDAPEYTKMKDLPKMTHERIFDFDYPLSTEINKEDFECQILKHFMLRRIGFDTFNMFKIYLDNKLNEIMPYYNILFDSLSKFNLFNDGEKITRTENENSESAGSGHVTSDRRFNQFPQNKLQTIKNGSYVTSQNFDENDSTNEVNANRILNEETNRSPVDKMYLYEKYLNTKKSIMSRVYKDLDDLFYQLN